MKNVILYLIGYPGTGKYTIAKEICRQEDFKLVDNHLVNNPIFSLIKQDGKSPLPHSVWENVGKIWGAVLDTIVYISPREYNFVLTNCLFNENEDDCVWFREVQAGALERKSVFIPIRLTISITENEKRIVMPDRRQRMKDINPAAPLENSQKYTIINTGDKNELTLDVSDLSAQEAAQAILNHARNCI